MEEIKDNINKPIEKKKEKVCSEGFLKFIDALNGHSKDVSIILRCHSVAEYFLDQIILTSLSRGDLIITDGHFTFNNKLLLVRSLNVVKDDILTSIKHLNTVRNNCSHQMDYSVSEGDIDLIGRPFGKDYSESRRKNKKIDDLLKNTLMITIARLEGSYNRLIKKEEKK